MSFKNLKCLFFFIIIVYFYLLLISRNPLVVDDVTPGEDSCRGLLHKAEILYVIPLKENHTIARDLEWCKEIRGLNKTIGLHGIHHSFHEFSKDIDEKELVRAIELFEECFWTKPKLFRPPYNKINRKNLDRVANLNLTLYKDSYIQHPYCHCDPKSLRMKFLNWILFC